MKCSFLDYFQLLMISWAILAMKVNQNEKKSPLSHQKMKCSFLDYVQLLMIGWVIWVTKVNQNAKKGPLSHQKIKCSFLDYVQLLMIGQVILAKKVTKMQKRPPESSKNQMLIFGLCSTSDNWPNLSDESQPKCKKGPLSHQNINSHFWITFNFWWLAEQSEWQRSTKMQKKAP